MNSTTGKATAATGHRLTTQAALEIINTGGNAFDGAIAAAFMACVCEPILASPGGGGFAMTRTASGTHLTDFFAQTPLDINNSALDYSEIEADFGTAKQIFHIGNASSATPGFIPGLFALHEKFASLPMEKLITPARKAAFEGIEVTPFQYYLTTVISPILLHTKQSRAVFAPDGQLKQSGEIFHNRDMADFFDQLGTRGQSAFPLGNILADQKDAGHLRAADFENYKVIDRSSHCIDVAGSKVHLNPIPAAGGILIALAFDRLSGSSTLDIARALAEIDHIRRQSNNDLNTLLSQLGPPAHRGTTHISVVDHNHNACSMTLSNGEGNGIMVDDCGFMLNNMLGEADVNPAGKLGWPVNTRLSSMMCPTIVEHKDGSVLALGSGGSNRIRSAIFQVLTNLLIKGKSLQDSVTTPRLHIENGHLDFELPDDEQTIRQLKEAFSDHRMWPEKNMFFGGCHIACQNKDHSFNGIGDHRRHGYFASL